MASLAMMPGEMPPGPQGPAAVSALLDTAPRQEGAVASQEEISRQVMTQIRDLQEGVEGLARQYPMVADLANQVKQLLVQAMVKIVGSVGTQAGSEAPTPRVIG